MTTGSATVAVVMATTGRPYRGMTPEARDADRRRRLLDAGLEAFGTTGYASTTIEGLCAAAGVTPRNFYDHFKSREDLLAAVYDAVIAEHAGAVVRALEEVPGDLEGHVRAGVDAAVRRWAGDERAARITLVEVVGVSERMEEHRLGVLAAYADLLRADAERLAERGLIPRREERVVAPALVGALTQVMTDWQHRPDERPPIETVIDELTRLYVAVLI
ncbi:MAG TPA: TetR/AcrR family transcriptional regulator [Solirubrobacteraceae bacterium]|jgi:AcrR family transcriptional regulator